MEQKPLLLQKYLKCAIQGISLTDYLIFRRTTNIFWNIHSLIFALGIVTPWGQDPRSEAWFWEAGDEAI